MAVPSLKAKLLPKVRSESIPTKAASKDSIHIQAASKHTKEHITPTRAPIDEGQQITASGDSIKCITTSTHADQGQRISTSGGFNKCITTSTPTNHKQHIKTGTDVVKSATTSAPIGPKQRITISKEGIKYTSTSPLTNPLQSIKTKTDGVKCTQSTSLALSRNSKQNLSSRFSTNEEKIPVGISSCNTGAKIRKPVKLSAPRPIKIKSESQPKPEKLEACLTDKNETAKYTSHKSKESSSHLVQNNPEERRTKELSDKDENNDPSSHKKNVVEGNFKKISELDLIKLLNPKVLNAIKRCGLIHPSPIQKECLPIACTGKDLVCQAKSGTGKTLVFILASLQQISPHDGEISTLIMCTTRELAMQIGKDFNEILEFIPNVKIGIFVGGVPVDTDKMILKENCPHIVVGTPGRILDLVTSKSLPLKNIKHFILDECDKMLENLDMRQDVQKVYIKTPLDKQVMMFSATFSEDIKTVCRKFMKNPSEVYIVDDAKLALDKLQQFFISLEEPQKKGELVKLLNKLNYNKVFIFVNSVMKSEEVASFLISKNFGAKPIHGGMPQPERTANYKEFENLPKRILVATKVFSRGMDITDGNVVINYDMAENTDDYLHRVGRAGRFETKGVTFSFVKKGANEKILTQVEDRFKVKIQPFSGEELIF